MLERLQSALKSVKDSKASLMSHRFVTVRRGSPAARSGQVQPGDQLEAVEGRPVGALQHRDLAQILRRAGNTLRLSITPRHHSEGADLDLDSRLIKGPRGRPKDESRFYSVDLERGPTGFGFSLRGGSEYNMGLYVLGLMEGGPAQRSAKIQVSDQLVEINGDSTSGMTHSQAVEQIRRGGHRIHLVLKKGNGYVPDYGPEEGALSPSSSSPTEEQDVDTVTMTTVSLSQQWGGGRGTGGGERTKQRTRREGETVRRTGGGRGGERLGPPDLDLDIVEEDAREEERRKDGREERRRRSQTVRQKEKPDAQTEQGRSSRSLPRSIAPSWDTFVPEERVEVEESGRGVRERRRRKSEMKSRRRATEEVNERRHSTARHPKHSGTSAPAQRAAFSFLGPVDDDDERPHPSDCESAASFSEVSQSAASIATTEWREDSDWRRAELPWEQGNSPGRWLKPTTQRLSKVLIGSRLGRREVVGGLSL